MQPPRSDVATLPGIAQASYAMPDALWGYGFPIADRRDRSRVSPFRGPRGVRSPADRL